MTYKDDILIRELPGDTVLTCLCRQCGQFWRVTVEELLAVAEYVEEYVEVQTFEWASIADVEEALICPQRACKAPKPRGG